MSIISPLRVVVPAGLAWGTFASMAGLVGRYGYAPFDAPVLEALHRRAHPELDRLAIFFARAGDTGPLVAAGLFTTAALVATGQRRAAWQFTLGLGGSMLLTQVIKRLAARPRPTLWVSQRPEHTYSFPSGHAMDAAALAAALFFALPHARRAWVPAPLFAAGVGWSRLYLGVHFPSDVLAGWGAGAGWVLLVQLLAARQPTAVPQTSPLR
ncbi:MAG: phosphatase PAP2 family protein [Janthinobacterium lividum]